METDLLKKRALLYLITIYSVLLSGWLLVVVLPEPSDQTAYRVVWGLFSVLPVLATILTRIITKDKSPWYLKPNFRQSWKTYLLAAFWSGVLMMILVCVVLGSWLAYVTIKSESILPAAIFHSAGNVIGELPLLVSFSSISPLVGLNPTGLIDMSGLLTSAIFLL